MIIYRPHRGSLKDAMAEARVFADAEEMKRWIVHDSAKQRAHVGKGGEVVMEPAFDIADIVIKDGPIPDHRIGWNDTRYVCVKCYGGEVYPVPQCIGMCATYFPAAEVN